MSAHTIHPRSSDAESRAPRWGVVPRAEPEPLEWRPPPSLRERVLAAVGVPAVVGVVLFTGGVASAVVLGMAQPHAPEVETTAAVVGSGPARTPPGAAAEPGSSTIAGSGSDAAQGVPDVVLVHVVGRVKRPGLVEVPAGARVSDALRAAGGASDQRALRNLNLARVVVDGEQLVVARNPQPLADARGSLTPPSSRAPSGGSPHASGGSAPSGPAAAGATLINVNSADVAELDRLPRVGPALAQRIVEWREANGGFASIEQLLDVPGIGATTLEGFRAQVAV